MSEEKQNTNTGSKERKKVVIPRPNNILMDIYGVVTSLNFKQQLKDYIRNNINDFLTRNFDDKAVVLCINKLREQALIDRSGGIKIPLIENHKNSKDVVIKSVVTNILWQMDNRHQSSQKQLNTIFNQIWTEGYNSGRLKVHTFGDVKPAIDHWRFHQFVKIYSYASGHRDGQKLFLSASTEGDLSKYFANYIDSSGGYKYDSKKFKVIISALRESDPQNLLYFTDEPKKARAAIEAGLRAIVVLRPGNETYSAEDLNNLITIQSFEDIVFEEEPGKPAPCC